MIRFDPQARIRPTAKSKAFLDHLKEMEIFPRRVDAYAFAAALAIRNDLSVQDMPLDDRSDLVRIGLLESDVRLSLASALQRAHKTPIVDSSELMDAFILYGEAGVSSLEVQWSSKSRVQVLQKLTSSIL